MNLPPSAAELRHLTETETFFADAAALGLPVTEAQFAQIVSFYHLLLETNQTMNLTRITDWPGFLRRHVLESLYFSSFIPQGAQVLDLGSGGGFPLLPLAIYRPDARLLAVESVQKKARYLEESAARLGLQNVSVAAERAETLGQSRQHRGHFDVITSRAVAALPVLLELCTPFLKREGLMLALKSARWEAEIRAAENAMDVLGVEFADVAWPDAPADLQETCYMVQFIKVKPTPKGYPRQPGIPARQPL